ncbi:tyrosine-type recombinase/integrase, partial [Brevibacillus laterosporus]|uniref:tyrosine-type recombinase/integrase n=1 Tax=Brevibacillus laterosporus TaxID=1465 RepID=UPI0022A68607
RHPFATNFLLNGGNIVTLSKILGHADVSTTKRYLNLSHDDITPAHSKYTPLNEIAVSDR